MPAVQFERGSPRLLRALKPLTRPAEAVGELPGSGPCSKGNTDASLPQTLAVGDSTGEKGLCSCDVYSGPGPASVGSATWRRATYSAQAIGASLNCSAFLPPDCQWCTH